MDSKVRPTRRVLLMDRHRETPWAVRRVDRRTMVNDLKPLQSPRNLLHAARRLVVSSLDPADELAGSIEVVCGDPFNPRLTINESDAVGTVSSIHLTVTKSVCGLGVELSVDDNRHAPRALEMLQSFRPRVIERRSRGGGAARDLHAREPSRQRSVKWSDLTPPAACA